jgi:AcrR family transcriptional regulator
MIRTAPKSLREDNEDGRRQRAARNREAVVGALLEIIKEQDGGPIPGAAEVAERAGVSERTVFRHFADLESLFLAGAARQRPIVESYLAPRPNDAELEKRVAAMVRLRARMWEELGPVRRVALRAVANEPALGATLEMAHRAGRHQLAEVFSPELQRAGRSQSLVLDQIDIAMSFATWESLRYEMGASLERSRKVTTGLLMAILSPYTSRRPR